MLFQWLKAGTQTLGLRVYARYWNAENGESMVYHMFNNRLVDLVFLTCIAVCLLRCWF